MSAITTNPKRRQASASSPTVIQPQAPVSAGLPSDEFARAISWHPESVRKAIRQGRIRAIKFGRFFRIPTAEVERILRDGIPSAGGAA